MKDFKHMSRPTVSRNNMQDNGLTIVFYVGQEVEKESKKYVIYNEDRIINVCFGEEFDQDMLHSYFTLWASKKDLPIVKKGDITPLDEEGKTESIIRIDDQFSDPLSHLIPKEDEEIRTEKIAKETKPNDKAKKNKSSKARKTK